MDQGHNDTNFCVIASAIGGGRPLQFAVNIFRNVLLTELINQYKYCTTQSENVSLTD
jgi:hypothetical protein